MGDPANELIVQLVDVNLTNYIYDQFKVTFNVFILKVPDGSIRRREPIFCLGCPHLHIAGHAGVAVFGGFPFSLSIQLDFKIILKLSNIHYGDF